MKKWTCWTSSLSSEVCQNKECLEVGKSTNLKQSPRKFVDAQSHITQSITPLDTLEHFKDYKRVNAEVKVQVVHHPEDIGNNRKKQDIIVSDSTAHTKITIWEDDIGKMNVRR